MLYFIALNVLFVLVPQSFSLELPSYFPICYQDDPELNNCILKAANVLRPYVRKGIEEIKLPSLNPLTVSHLDITETSQLANFSVTAWNYTIRGMDTYDIQEIGYDPETKTFHGRMIFDRLPMNAHYDIQGRFLSIPMFGKGFAKAVFGPFNGTFEVNGEIVQRKGVDYYNPTSTKIEITVKDGTYHFDRLFNGDEELARATNEVINSNSQMVTKAVTPVFERLAEEGLMRLMKSLTRAIPYYKIFPLSN